MYKFHEFERNVPKSVHVACFDGDAVRIICHINYAIPVNKTFLM